MPSAMSALPQPLQMVLPHNRKRCSPRPTPSPQMGLPQPRHLLGCPVYVPVIEAALVGSNAVAVPLESLEQCREHEQTGRCEVVDELSARAKRP